MGFIGTNELCSNNLLTCNEWGGVSLPGLDGTYNTNYFNKISVIASTSGNYSGIYDMSGGAWEYMMSGMDDNSTGDGKNGKLVSGRHNVWNSGFNGKLSCPSCNDSGVNHEITEITNEFDLPIDERFYDKYDYSTSSNAYNRGFLGDATKEMGPFQIINYGNQTRRIGSWYDNEAWFVYSSDLWFRRVGDFYDGTSAGLFYFSRGYGNLNFDFSFRLVLAF